MNLLWDIEQTLLNPLPGITSSMRRALIHSGHFAAADQDLDWITQLPMRDSLAVLLNTHDGKALDYAEHSYYQEYQHRGRFENEFYPGADQLLSHIAGDAGLQSHYVTHVGRDGAEQLLTHYQLHKQVRRLYTGSEFSCPGIRLQLLSEVHQRISAREPSLPSESILLSDCPRELQHAKTLGIPAIAIGYGPMAEQLISNAELVARSPQDVIHFAAVLQRRTGGQTLH